MDGSSVESSISVFGEDVLLWVCLLRQSSQRPPPEHVHRQAHILLDELKNSPAAMQLPVVSADDGLFAVAALIDEVAMSYPDLRHLWSTHSMQAIRWNTTNAGVEFFERLGRVRQGPKSVLATYLSVLALGFHGKYGLPGAERGQLPLLCRELQRDLGADPDRDRQGGALALKPGVAGPAARFGDQPFTRSVWFGRALAGACALVAGVALVVVLT